jgi:ubiquinol-cytochrome c reductase cytochrome b subunit
MDPIPPRVSFLKRSRAWLDTRLPLTTFIQKHITHYYLPANLNGWYVFGALSLFFLILQFFSGFWLMMFYTPTPEAAFNSIEYLMRDVPYGWFIRYLHSSGASFFFILLYAHLLRGLLYGSYKRPRELVWLLGVLLYLLSLSEAFLGYLLPWGQMSYWASQVATSAVGTFPFFGETLMHWLRGDSNVSAVTLHRFFALHSVGLPTLFIFLVGLHLIALRTVGSTRPQGIASSTRTSLSSVDIPFHPYYTSQDLLALAISLFIFSLIVFFMPEMGGYFLEASNFIPANPQQTPNTIRPLWYLAPFYSLLCVIPHSFFGTFTVFCAPLLFFLLPWLDKHPPYTGQRNRLFKLALISFVLSFMILGFLGATAQTMHHLTLLRLCALFYFLFFLLMPFYTRQTLR